MSRCIAPLYCPGIPKTRSSVQLLHPNRPTQGSEKFRMETLNAQRQSGDSRPHQLRQVFGIDSAWIRLHRQLSIGMNEGTPVLSGAAPSPLGASGPLRDPAKQFGQ